jgi:hypothetical protein
MGTLSLNIHVQKHWKTHMVPLLSPIKVLRNTFALVNNFIIIIISNLSF